VKALTPLLLTLLGCPGPKVGAGPAPEPLADGAVNDQPLGDDLPAGLSGLTWLPEGRMLAVSERGQSVVLLDPTRRRPSEVRPVVGVPEGVDLEAVAALGGERVAFGTESQDPERRTDLVLLGTLGPDGVAIEQAMELAWAPFGLEPGMNSGIEAVCSAGGMLVAVGEQVGRVGGRRYAPVWLRSLSGGPVRTARLLLSSDEGKVSGIACRTGADRELELTGVERQFSTIRLVRWTLPMDGAEPVLPSSVKDLGASLGASPPNPEGLALDPAGGVWLVSDNDYGGVNGPAHLVRIAPE
jgi:hypothetical protein